MQYYRNTIGYCKKITSFQKRLNAGRVCQYNHQCNSLICTNGICRGKQQGSDCSSHEECDIFSSCRSELSWPFETKCRAFAPANYQCNSDYDCDISYSCIYQSVSQLQNGIKQCTLKFSLSNGAIFGWQEYNVDSSMESALKNGEICKLGFAFKNGDSGVCSSILYIRTKSSDAKQIKPYPCNPSTKVTSFDQLNNVNNCRYYFANTQNGYYEDECSCAMNGGQEGYCKYPGQEELNDYITIVKQILSYTRCHTLDRENILSQAECGIGAYDLDKYKNIVNSYNKFHNWPLSQTNTSSKCFEKINPMSYQGILNYTQIISKATKLSKNQQQSNEQLLSIQIVRVVAILVAILNFV
ncbi:UNKNOWN [Stylonychia lemnae]|uniref:Dickkopf N-terminal cysteine-rich domain-containing protein n=1 Tax=Stylonychia lemnae TaxID=5949 RepID=A0A077ZQG5_STYLE|nr:UNKNOWN [Stylonychia lemnae]|eukprot:CDW72142.1 UNKNOWN [Stylonychia lemnae]